MSEIMLALGDFRFSIDTAAYDQFRRTQSWRWVSQARLARRPAKQFVGPGEETLSLSGTIYPHYRGGVNQLEAMRALAGEGQSLRLIDGMGVLWGFWVITEVDEQQQYFHASGQPLKQTFRLQIAHYGEDNAQL